MKCKNTQKHAKTRKNMQKYANNVLIFKDY